MTRAMVVEWDQELTMCFRRALAGGSNIEAKDKVQVCVDTLHDQIYRLPTVAFVPQLVRLLEDLTVSSRCLRFPICDLNDRADFGKLLRSDFDSLETLLVHSTSSVSGPSAGTDKPTSHPPSSTARAAATPLPDFLLTATVRGDVLEDYRGKDADCSIAPDHRFTLSALDARAKDDIVVEVQGFTQGGTFPVSDAGPGVVDLDNGLGDELRAASGSVTVSGGGGAFAGSFDARFATGSKQGITVHGTFVCANATWGQ